ncbi:EamA family transporter [candidate division KSB1 bacterium]|nr:EamA family transporter [candidate division KSB1 bacterium]
MNSQHSLTKKPNLGLLYAFAGTVLLSTNYITAKYGLRGFNPETFSLIWTAAASVYSFMIILLTGGTSQLFIPAGSIGRIIGLGVITGAGMLFTWAGLALLDPTFMAFLFRLHPVLNILLGVLVLHEVFRRKELLPISIVIVGGLISVIERWNIVYLGVIFTLLAIVSVSFQMLIAKERIEKVHPKGLVFYRVMIAMLVIAAWTIVTGKINFDVKLSYWLVTLLGALFGPTLSFIFFFHSYQHWDFYRSSMVITIQPVLVLPWAYLFLGEFPNALELIGGSIIMLGAFWLMWIHFRYSKEPLNVDNHF